jgi:hypothetical protein
MMIEKVNRISNPLTIIAIFAALAEIAGTVSLGLVDQTLQSIFVWFVMLFPIILVVLFFLTLNFNRRVLYGPSDFQNEEHFIRILMGHYELTQNLEDLSIQLESTQQDIIQQTKKRPDEVDVATSYKIIKSLEHKITSLSDKIHVTQASADIFTDEVVASRRMSPIYSQNPPKYLIQTILKKEPGGLSLSDISKRTRLSPRVVYKTLRSMAEDKTVLHESIDKLRSVYRLSEN